MILKKGFSIGMDYHTCICRLSGSSFSSWHRNDQDMTVDEVGVAVGMGDANYFSRMIRIVEGISPREYRKQW